MIAIIQIIILIIIVVLVLNRNNNNNNNDTSISKKEDRESRATYYIVYQGMSLSGVVVVILGWDIKGGRRGEFHKGDERY
jgi:uncharacterized membrane protein